MDTLTREWAGRSRDFRLAFGQLLDLEQSRKCGLGEIFLRLTAAKWYASDVFEIIRFGLIGAGMKPADALDLVKERFEKTPVFDHLDLAIDLLTATMSGIEPDGDDGDPDTKEPGDPYKVSDFAGLCKALSISPAELRELRYSDLVNIIRGMEIAGGNPPHLTEDEHNDILARYEPEALKAQKAN